MPPPPNTTARPSPRAHLISRLRKSIASGGTKRTTIDWESVPFGAASDAVLAAELGVSRQAVTYQRNRRRLPAGRSSPSAAQLTLLELEAALSALYDDARPALSIATAHAVDLVPGWMREMRRSSRQRVVRVRFRRGGSRTWTQWLTPRRAKTWLLTWGWADAAEQRVRELREQKQEEARA